MKINTELAAKMDERFGHDTLIALATVDGDSPAVRTVNAFYENGAFYTITHAQSGKMHHIAKNPRVAVCGEWFTAHGVGESLGHVLLPDNMDMLSKLRTVFAAWYGNGHVNEADPDTILLRVRLTDGILFWQGTRYDIEF